MARKTTQTQSGNKMNDADFQDMLKYSPLYSAPSNRRICESITEAFQELYSDTNASDFDYSSLL